MSTDHRYHTAAIIGAGILMCITGTVWTLQGFGASYAPRSFMTSQPEWIVIGIVTLAAGIGTIGYAVRR